MLGQEHDLTRVVHEVKLTEIDSQVEVWDLIDEKFLQSEAVKQTYLIFVFHQGD